MSVVAEPQCQLCSKPGKLRCSGCKAVYYCSIEHQSCKQFRSLLSNDNTNTVIQCGHQVLWKTYHRTFCGRDESDYYLPDITRKEADLYCKTRELSFDTKAIQRGCALMVGDFFLIPPLVMPELDKLVKDDDTLGTLEAVLKKKLPYRNVFEYFWQSLYLDSIPLRNKNSAIAALQLHLHTNESPMVKSSHSTRRSETTGHLSYYNLHSWIVAFEGSEFPYEVENAIFRELILLKAIFDLEVSSLGGPVKSFEFQSEVWKRLDALVNILWFSPCKSNGSILIQLSMFLAAFVVRKADMGYEKVGDTGEVFEVTEVKKFAIQRFRETWPEDLVSKEG